MAFHKLTFVIILFAGFAVTNCGGNADLAQASAAITSQRLSDHIRVLASDEFEGRQPGRQGGKKTTDYLQEQFAALGLKPGNGDSYLQDVALVTISHSHPKALTFTAGGQSVVGESGTNYLAESIDLQEQVTLDGSAVVFVGYGVVAPEENWDDYAGLDLAGKTVVTLVNDPGYATQDPNMFSGNAMTYYGRYTYKFEEARRQGARGVIVVHETGPAGYPWMVIGGSAGRSNSVLASQGESDRPPVHGWITDGLAREAFALAGADFDALKAAALEPDFKAVELELTVSIDLRSEFDYASSNNVLGLLPGSTRPEELVIYMAHWDHLGVDAGLEGDQIYNGAADNASGTAGIIEIARAFTQLETQPERSILFLAVTAEEQGLLGSAYYGTHPVYPLHNTVAAINVDVLNLYGPMRDITIIGLGNSQLDDYVSAAGKAQGRQVFPDPSPEKGFFFRSDHFSIAKVGVPALYVEPGVDHIEFGKEWTKEQDADWTENRYHQPADEFDPDWDLRGAVDDLRLIFDIGYHLANTTAFPNWVEGNAFKAMRDDMMKAKGD